MRLGLSWTLLHFDSQSLPFANASNAGGPAVGVTGKTRTLSEPTCTVSPSWSTRVTFADFVG
jgi:hypothetical protein